MTQVWTISYSAVFRASSCFEQHVAIFSSCRDVCSGLVFKFVGSEKISRIWKSLMQVWINITGHHGFLREVIELFVDGSNKAEPYVLLLFRAINCHFPS